MYQLINLVDLAAGWSSEFLAQAVYTHIGQDELKTESSASDSTDQRARVGCPAETNAAVRKSPDSTSTWYYRSLATSGTCRTEAAGARPLRAVRDGAGG